MGVKNPSFENSSIVYTSRFGGGEEGFLAAIAEVQAGRGAVVFVDEVGEVLLENEVAISSWTRDIKIMAAGEDVTTIKINANDKSILKGVPAQALSLCIESVKFKGFWADNNKQAAGEKWLISVSNIKKYTQNRATFESSQKGLVKVSASEKAESTFCTGREAARGGFNFTGSGRINVLGNDFEHLGDDAISAHVASAATYPYGTQHQITGNSMRDCQGISALGLRNSVVTGNTGKLLRGRFIEIGYDVTFGEGRNSLGTVVVSGNTCEDLINTGAFDAGSSDLGHYIKIKPYAASDGGVLSGVPASNDMATGEIVSFYGNAGGVGDRAVNVMAGGNSIVITSNVLTRTEAAGVLYSSYGRGLYFTAQGYQDAMISEAHFWCEPFFLEEGIAGFLIDGNVTRCGGRGVFFSFGGGGRGFSGAVKNNMFIDTPSDAIDTNASAAGYPNVMDVEFEGNLFDVDPYFRSAERDPAGNGEWLGTSKARVYFVPYCTGLIIGANRYKNASKVLYGTTGSPHTRYEFVGVQSLECFPVGWDNNAGNRGIRDVMRPSDFVRHIIVNSNPKSVNYGDILLSPLTSNVEPSYGLYVKGAIVKNTNKSVDANGNVVTGWMRVGTGDTHGGAQWVTLYASTVSAA